MKKYKCLDCGNNFVLDEFDALNCPQCQSSNIVLNKRNLFEVILEFFKEWKKNKTFFYSSVGVLGLLIILGIVGCPKKYEVHVVPNMQECKIEIFVKSPSGSNYSISDFRYSLDNGNTWQGSNEFFQPFSGQFYVKVKMADNSSANFVYKFTNPIAWQGGCEDVDKTVTCDDVTIQSVNNVINNNQIVITVTTSPINCKDVQYSFSGDKGPWQTKNSTIIPCDGKEHSLNIFIKKKNGDIVSYNMNPFVLQPCVIVAKCPSAKEVEALMNQLVKSPGVDNMYKILDLFESHNVVVNFTYQKEEQTIYSYLQYLQTVTDVGSVKVVSISCNSSKRINKITISN